jgi:hypothetical protein
VFRFLCFGDAAEIRTGKAAPSVEQGGPEKLKGFLSEADESQNARGTPGPVMTSGT